MGWTPAAFVRRAAAASPGPEAQTRSRLLLAQCSTSVQRGLARGLAQVVEVDVAAVARATGGFDDARRVGAGPGGAGAVYRGTLAPFGDVAVTRHAARDDRDLIEEVEALARMRDPRIVHVLAYARDAADWVLVSELMTGGSLRSRLACVGYDGAATAALTWHHRLRIAFDISAALYYLHACRCAFADLTSAAVLLDAAGQAKLANFGLADPKEPSPSSDAFLFGVVLFELITGLAASDDRREPRDLVALVRAVGTGALVDAKLAKLDPAADAALARMSEMAHRCVSDDDRPSIESIHDILGEMELHDRAPPAVEAAVISVDLSEDQGRPSRRGSFPSRRGSLPTAGDARPEPPPDLAPTAIPVSEAPVEGEPTATAVPVAEGVSLRILTGTFNMSGRAMIPGDLVPWLKHGTMLSGRKVVVADVVAVAFQEVPRGLEFALIEQQLMCTLEQHEHVASASIGHIMMGMRLVIFRRRTVPWHVNVCIHNISKTFLSAGSLVGSKGACASRRRNAAHPKNFFFEAPGSEIATTSSAQARAR